MLTLYIMLHEISKTSCDWTQKLHQIFQGKWNKWINSSFDIDILDDKEK